MEVLITEFMSLVAGAFLWLIRGFFFAAGAYLFFALFVGSKVEVEGVIHRTGDDEGRGL